MAGQLRQAGWLLTGNPAEAAVIVVNTCSFVESAINESIDTILELASYKKSGHCRRLVVAGCLPERFREAIVTALPEVDQFLGTGAFTSIVDAVNDGTAESSCLLLDPDLIPIDETTNRERTLSYTAYLKIAEGCSRHCTYCIIPRLRGRQKSRPIDRIVAEARELIDSGVKELNLVSQDTTHYGADLPDPMGLDTLLARLAELRQDIWIRFLYGHPESIEPDVFAVVAEHGNICSYFDIPIQHINDRVLAAMGRGMGRKKTEELLRKFRSMVPDIVLRTTILTGFPGEDEEAFEELMSFLESFRFERLGVFPYSHEEDTPAYRELKDSIPDSVKQERVQRIMELQQQISSEINRDRVGQTYRVLIDRREGDYHIARTKYDSPEVDNEVLITGSEGLDPGSFLNVRITGAEAFDLYGTVV